MCVYIYICIYRYIYIYTYINLSVYSHSFVDKYEHTHLVFIGYEWLPDNTKHIHIQRTCK